MEQAVWIYFGVITVVISFGIVGKLIAEHKSQQKDEIMVAALERLGQHCDFMCKSAPTSQISRQVELPSGVVLRWSGERICGDYRDLHRCVVCGCELRPDILDLNTSIALATFSTHEYSCTFLRNQNDIEMACQG